MPKGSPELTRARKDEIINACAELYETMNFKDVTLKEIAFHYEIIKSITVRLLQGFKI